MNDELLFHLSTDPNVLLSRVPAPGRRRTAWAWVPPTLLTVALVLGAWAVS